MKSYSLHWDHYFKHIVEKYNSIYKVQMPEITPYFTPFAGVNMLKYAYVMPANGNTKGV